MASLLRYLPEVNRLRTSCEARHRFYLGSESAGSGGFLDGSSGAVFAFAGTALSTDLAAAASGFGFAAVASDAAGRTGFGAAGFFGGG